MGIFEFLESLQREFFDAIDELCEGFDKKTECENENGKNVEETKCDEDFSSYTCSKKDKYVNGEHVSHDEEVWKDGKCIKDEHYCKNGSIDTVKNKRIEDTGCSFKRCKCADSKVKKGGDIEYTIEFNDDDEVDVLKKKNESLRKSVNQLCADAENDHNEIARLKKENEELKTMLGKLSEGMKGITGMIDSIGE